MPADASTPGGARVCTRTWHRVDESFACAIVRLQVVAVTRPIDVRDEAR